MRKYQSVERVEILPPKKQEEIAAGLKSLGKTSAVQLTDAERRNILDS